MNNMIKCFLSVFMACVAFGCKKEWLDIKADKQQSIPWSLDDYQKMLDYTFYMNYFIPALGEVASDGHYISEASWLANLSDLQRNSYTWSQTRPYRAVNDWNNSYTKIFYCNIILDGLKKINPEKEEEKQQFREIKGQALFQRASTFFWLAQVWGMPFVSTTANIDYGISLRLDPDATIPSSRASVGTTYDQIISDLHEAAKLLSVTPKYFTRGSKPAAFAMLARTYLITENYDSVLSCSNQCLQTFNTLLDFNTLPTAANFIGRFDEIIFYDRLFSSSYSLLTTRCLIDSMLHNLYSNDDLRKKIFYRSNSNGTITFKGNYNNSTSVLFAGIATNEVYLMRSEAFARLGNMDDAMADLNMLLEKRWKNTVPYPQKTAISADDALSQIITERKKELPLRGLRWYDLKRLNKDNRFQVTLSRTIGGNNYTLEPKSFKYTFPVPIDVIELSGMPQSPGW